MIEIKLFLEFLNIESFDDINVDNAWGKVMVLIDKIETLHDNGFDITIYQRGCSIDMHRSNDNGKLHNAIPIVDVNNADIYYNSKIEYVVDAIIQFIHWWNDGKKIDSQPQF